MSLIGKHVLIVAYAFEPNKTSEPGVGWYFVHEIAKFMKVTVVTRMNNRPFIEAEIKNRDIKLIYYDLPQSIMYLKKRIPFGIQIYYNFWQKGVYRMINKLINCESLKIDVIHHLTFGMTKNVPSVRNIDLPFIWGPVGGGDKIPLPFLWDAGFKTAFEEFVYRFVHKKSNFSFTAYQTRKKAAAIIFRTESSSMNMPQNGCKKRYLISETAIPSILLDTEAKSTKGELACICVGRLMFGKGYIYALKGFHQFILNGGRGKLIIIGKGPEEKKLKRFTKKYGLQDFVDFKGFISNDEVKRLLKLSHVLLHPSFREGGSWSIMEAMSFGLPVVCLNTSGPKDMVTDQCGFLIDMHTPDQVIKDISEALFKMENDPILYKNLQSKAVKRIKVEYNWERRREQIKQVYEDID